MRPRSLSHLKPRFRFRCANSISTYGPAIAALKKEGRLPKDTRHYHVQYSDNVVEADHGKLKRLIKPTLGFQSLKIAYATLKGFEVMQALKKGQGSLFGYLPGVAGEVSLVHRDFGLT